MPKTSLHWFRRDLRLTDNTALHQAARESGQVIPVYILSTWKKEHDWTGPNRQQFLCGNLNSLARNLEALGSRLVLRQGHALLELEKLLAETGADALYTNASPDPFGRAMEREAAVLCARRGVALHVCKDAVLHGPREVLTDKGSPCRVYTPYSRKWLALPKPVPLPRVRSLGPATPVPSLPLPTLAVWGLPPCTASLPAPGERAARERMKRFIESGALLRYAEKRNLPATPGTSGLSPDLRHGLIGIRELYHRCQEAAQDAGAEAAGKEGILTYARELAWREFYMSVLHHWPEVLETGFNEDFRAVPWEDNEAGFTAWKEGRTGFPLVDAGMRQLLATGWMHNRLRMTVSMFLTKDLHVHWMRGESYFMQLLVDGEIASNNGGWQWSAGTGADAAPWFRIQNPWTQTKSHDPAGAFIQQWVPELRDVPPEKLLSPPPAGRTLHRDYPPPIVDHTVERLRTLARFSAVRMRRRERF